jgi:hypothetical protein
MSYTNYISSSALSSEQLYLVARARRQPAAFVLSGVEVGEDSVLRQGQFKFKLRHGPLNYWFMRDWASVSLGNDCPEIVDVHPDHLRIPPQQSPIPAFVSSEIVVNERVSCNFVSHTVFGINGRIVSHEELQEELLLKRRPSFDLYDLYKFFSCQAYFMSCTHDLVAETMMPMLAVPIVPLRIILGRLVYRRSQAHEFDDQVYEDLKLRGYVFRQDRVNSTVYYTNSVAVHMGYPPTSTALGLPLLRLSSPGGDWKVKVERLDVAKRLG